MTQPREVPAVTTASQAYAWLTPNLTEALTHRNEQILAVRAAVEVSIAEGVVDPSSLLVVRLAAILG